jgi:thioesterase-3
VRFQELLKQADFLVVNININYRQPVAQRQVLEIRTQIARIGRKSAVMHQEIFIKGGNVPAADADITFVLVDKKTHTARFLKDLV